MIKFKADNTKTGNTLIGFGLSRMNCERLLADQPIHIDLAELGIAGYEVMIFGGETEEAMAAQLRKAGLVVTWK